MRITRDLNFKVTPDFHWRFKNAASQLGIPMTELLRRSFEALLAQKDHHLLRQFLNELQKSMRRHSPPTKKTHHLRGEKSQAERARNLRPGQRSANN